ncbi:MAG: pyridoxal phosphate-dependent decarboxylase family protein [Pseudomonadales bacterium]
MRFSWLTAASKLDVNRSLLPAALDQAERYLKTRSAQPVVPNQAILDRLKNFDEPLPEYPSDPFEILSTLEIDGAAATVASTGPNYYGFVTGGTLPIALASRWISDTWDQNSALAVMSPIAAKLEGLVAQWLTELFEFPDETAVGLVSGSSVASLCALTAARDSLLERVGWSTQQRGLFGAPPLKIFAPDSVHSAIPKALRILGFGEEHIHSLATDGQGRIDPKNLPQLDAQSVLILQAGQVCSGAFDDFEQIIPAAQAAGAWVHIDGAFGLWAAASSRLRHLTRGIALADSCSVDAHKTLNVPYDSGIVLCRRPEALSRALTASASYLVTDHGRDGMMLTPEMSRRARGIELWATLKFLGRQGLSDLVEHFHHLAEQLRSLLKTSEYEILSEDGFNQVLLALKDDVATDRALALIQDSKEVWLSGATWQGKRVIRVSICNWQTEPKDITRLAAIMAKAAERAS